MIRPSYLINIFLLLTVLCVYHAEAQTDSLNLDSEFQYLLDRSETYDVYKVIRTERLNDFWAEATDSLRTYQERITILKENSVSLEGKNKKIEAEMLNLKAELAKTLLITESISFLGLEMKKATYHLLVWMLILVLTVVTAWLGWLYKNSFDITQNAQKEQSKATAELEVAKEKSREQQVKLKRELQTALNQLEELRRAKG